MTLTLAWSALTLAARIVARGFRTLFTVDGQPKAVKGQSRGFLTAVLHLAPHRLAGFGNVCAHASKACIRACLNVSGHGQIGLHSASLADIASGKRRNSVQSARIARTAHFFRDLDAFKFDLIEETRLFLASAARRNMVPCIRLNGTSDIPWERVFPEIFAMFPEVQWYDYTKYPIEKRPPEKLPANYHLTMSYSGENADACLDALARGRNVAVVFAVKKGQPLPSTFSGYPVIDGDETDLRFLDPSPCIVGLRAKGRAIGDASAFVVQAPFTSVRED